MPTPFGQRDEEVRERDALTVDGDLNSEVEPVPVRRARPVEVHDRDGVGCLVLERITDVLDTDALDRLELREHLGEEPGRVDTLEPRAAREPDARDRPLPQLGRDRLHYGDQRGLRVHPPLPGAPEGLAPLASDNAARPAETQRVLLTVLAGEEQPSARRGQLDTAIARRHPQPSLEAGQRLIDEPRLVADRDRDPAGGHELAEALLHHHSRQWCEPELHRRRGTGADGPPRDAVRRTPK